MDPKLQALLETMVSETTMNNREGKEIEESIAGIPFDSSSCVDEQENENAKNDEDHSNEELNVKNIFKPSSDKPLHASLIAGLSRLNGFQCPHCPRILATKYSLQVHILVHTGERPHACSVCSSKFTTPGDLKRHMVIHTGEKPYKCDVCNARFTQSGSLKGHSRLHPGEKPHKCEDCGESFVAGVLLKAHMRFHSKTQQFKCTHCDKMFGSVELVMEHCQNFHILSFENPLKETDDSITAVVDVSTILYGRKPRKKKSPCPICGKVLSSVYALSIHKRTHTGEKPYACTSCDYKSTCPSVLKRHMLRHSALKPFKCEVCSKTFRQRCHLKKHMGCHQKNHKKCIKCSREFPGLTFLLEHWQIEHKDPLRPEICTDCFSQFETSEQLTEHRKETHLVGLDLLGEFKCEKCGLVFNRKGNLKRHTERSCRGPFNCEQCDVSFPRQNRLNEHMKKYHGVKEKYECVKCNKVFQKRYILKNHERRMHGPNGVKCLLCPNVSFASRKDYIDHKKIHFSPLIKFTVLAEKNSALTEKDKGPHKISVANCSNGVVKRFKDRSCLRKKMKLTIAKKFPCRICGKLFSNQRLVLDHFQSHRKNPGYFEEGEEDNNDDDSDDVLLDEMKEEPDNESVEGDVVDERKEKGDIIITAIYETTKPSSPESYATLENALDENLVAMKPS